jgi:hypothetical protein
MPILGYLLAGVQRVDVRSAACLDLEFVCRVPTEAPEPTSGEAATP